MSPRRVRVVHVAAALATAAAVALTSCGGSDYRYVKNSSLSTYFKVPDDWHLWDQDEIVLGSEDMTPQAREQLREMQWIVAFDGAPEPDPTGSIATAQYPQGFARVRAIQPDERDTFSLKDIRNEALEIDEVQAATNAVEVIESIDVVGPDGLRGSHLVFNVPRDGGGYFTVDQIAMVNAETTVVYALVVGCDAECYVKNESQIKEITDSWTVKEAL